MKESLIYQSLHNMAALISSVDHFNKGAIQCVSPIRSHFTDAITE